MIKCGINLPAERKLKDYAPYNATIDIQRLCNEVTVIAPFPAPEKYPRII